MTEKNLSELLRAYKSEKISETEIISALKNFSLATESFGFATIDHGRELRQGFPEVVYSPGKTKEQLKMIFKNLYERSNGNLIASRATREQFDFLREEIPEAVFDETARMIYVDRDKSFVRDESKKILIVTAGTSDVPVAEEARLTAYLWGNFVSTCYDCGVAGIHRLFA
ncbi:MAG: 1-(5-phosphoribosyl)-5-amino-4-imidazole-carboxylate carboxylase, partial [Selenomonadaceae bacterium]|nr:1-(5-phosphoribosyl)-5-amino-4-imidazole-carboxylate carboxylase [Selenomonadaceae bacterium]